MTRLLIEIKSTSANLIIEAEADTHVRIVVTPLVICQILGNGYTQRHHRMPGGHPSTDFPRLCLSPYISHEASTGLHLGAVSFVNQLPVQFLTFLRLHIERYIQEDARVGSSVR